MPAITISSGPLRGVQLQVAERRWSRTRRAMRAVTRRRAPRRPPTARQLV
ncbi:MAG: hypothetical protein AB7V42_03375 [Thermoleophilia bacterium]